MASALDFKSALAHLSRLSRGLAAEPAHVTFSPAFGCKSLICAICITENCYTPSRYAGLTTFPAVQPLSLGICSVFLLHEFRPGLQCWYGMYVWTLSHFSTARQLSFHRLAGKFYLIELSETSTSAGLVSQIHTQLFSGPPANCTNAHRSCQKTSEWQECLHFKASAHMQTAQRCEHPMSATSSVHACRSRWPSCQMGELMQSRMRSFLLVAMFKLALCFLLRSACPFSSLLHIYSSSIQCPQFQAAPSAPTPLHWMPQCAHQMTMLSLSA